MSTQLNYESLGEDGLGEIANVALAQIVNNIGDPNTEPKAVRELTIKVKFKPNEQRNMPTLTYAVTSKLAPVKPVEIMAMVDRGADGLDTLFIPEIGTRPDQLELPINNPKVTSIKEAQNG